MSLNKNTEYVINLDANINDLLDNYSRDYSLFALLPVLYKINYVLIYIALILVFLSVIVMTYNAIMGIILCVISVSLFIYTNCAYIKYLKQHQSEINLTRYQYLSYKLKEYDSFTINCIIKRLQLKRERNNSGIISVFIATFAVITLPIWESYVSIFFEKNIIGTPFNQQIRNFLILLICSVILLFLCMGIYFLTNLVKSIFSKDKFYDNLNDILEILVEKNDERNETDVT